LMFVFRGVQNREFCPQPPGIGFTAARKTNAIRALYGGPENKCAPHLRGHYFFLYCDAATLAGNVEALNSNLT
jgi:hypothetical protein